MFDLLGADVLSPMVTLGLIGLAGFTSMLTSALGLGGGMLLLATMAAVLPISALIPVHGLVQFGSNASRSLMTIRYLDKAMVVYFAIGGVIGAILASYIVVQLPLDWIQLAIGVFLLLIIWGGKPKAREMGKVGRVVAGILTTVLSMFVGASGPMVASVVYRNGYDKLTYTATFATCMTFQHCLKAIVFSFVGFAFWQWLPLIVAMIVSSVIGNWLGLKALTKVPAKSFQWGFKVILSLLSLRLLYQGLDSLLA
jgi:uncharacterized membrane protein YfcA